MLALPPVGIYTGIYIGELYQLIYNYITCNYCIYTHFIWITEEIFKERCKYNAYEIPLLMFPAHMGLRGNDF